MKRAAQTERPLILVTNDDGIDSPGLVAVVAALDSLGELLIVAPRTQQTSMGRSRSQEGGRDGRLLKRELTFGNETWPAVAANATPALTVEHAVQQVAERPISLVVSGINFGENVGTCVTVSGTIGAALEAAQLGIPAIAASLEIERIDHHTYDPTVDFTVAAYFVRLFAEKLLGQAMPDDVDLLKIDVPAAATKKTPWMIAPQDRIDFYQPRVKRHTGQYEEENVFIHGPLKGRYWQQGSDAHALANGIVAVTPLSLNLTSRTDLAGLSRLLGQEVWQIEDATEKSFGS